MNTQLEEWNRTIRTYTTDVQPQYFVHDSSPMEFSVEIDTHESSPMEFSMEIGVPDTNGHYTFFRDGEDFTLRPVNKVGVRPKKGRL